MNGWYGVDLDGTLARYDGWKGHDHIGNPIHPTVELVKDLLAQGKEVRIFTARVHSEQPEFMIEAIRERIESWCEMVIGIRLPVTNVKDFGMIALYDDRAIQVEHNTGRLIKDKKEEG